MEEQNTNKSIKEELMTKEMHKNIKDIANWLTFFGIMTILGIVASLLAAGLYYG